MSRQARYNRRRYKAQRAWTLGEVYAQWWCDTAQFGYSRKRDHDRRARA